MITKQCAGCGRYFTGQFDGDYTCAECRLLGIVAMRPLSPLGVHTTGQDEEVSPKPPQRVDDPATDRGTARGQAA